MELNNEQSQRMYEIAKGIAFKKYHTYRYYGIDVSDMASELFIRVKKDMDTHPNRYFDPDGTLRENLVAQVMYRKVVDIIRSAHRRVSKDSEIGDELERLPDNSPKSDPYSNTYLDDVISALGEPDGDFPGPNSKNKEYWYVWLLNKLEVEHDEDVINRVLAMPENAWMKKPRWQGKWPVDDIIATTLGYAGNYSSSFQKVKYRARQILTDKGYN